MHHLAAATPGKTSQDVDTATDVKLKVNDPKLSQFLLDRFFLIKKQGGQNFYYDSETGEKTLTTQHLLSHALQYGAEQNPEQILELLRHLNFHPTLLTERYQPGGGRMVNDKGNLHPNVWVPPKIKPNPYFSAQKFKDHLALMLGSEKKAAWVIREVAYRFQFFSLNEKPHRAMYFYGEKGGMGKSLFGETLENVFGSSAVRSVPDERSLKSMSGTDIWSRTWLIVQEFDVKRGSENYNTLKTMISGTSFSAERKHEHFAVRSTPAQLIMFSNHAPTFIEQYDRRFFVSKWQHEFKSEQDRVDYFNDYTRWLNDEGGLAAIAGLLSTYDVSDFNMSEAALSTQEKIVAMGLQEDEVDRALQEFLEDNADAWVFTDNDFKYLRQDHQVSISQWKHKLGSAGLYKHPERLRTSEHRSKTTFFLREGYVIEQKQGTTTRVRNPDGVRRTLAECGVDKDRWVVGYAK
jgi:hypothetical protein